MNKKIIIAIIAVLVPIAVYTGSPLFYNVSINESLPQTMTDANDASITQDTAQLLASGSFSGVNDGIHNAQGSAKIIQLSGGKQLLRLEDFKATNGPDLHVYLASDKSAQDYVDLGKLKANIGNQNYDIPEGTDLTKYNTALVWCKQFSVLFGSAEIK